MIGQDFFARVTVTNKTSKARDFQLSLKGHVVLYTGASGQLVKSLEQKMRLKGKESKSLSTLCARTSCDQKQRHLVWFHFKATLTSDLCSLVLNKRGIRSYHIEHKPKNKSFAWNEATIYVIKHLLLM